MSRRTAFRLPLALASLLALAAASGCVSTTPTSPKPATPKSEGSASAQVLRRVAAEVDEYSLRGSVGLRLARGLPVEEFQDLSFDGVRNDAAFGKRLLAELAAAREEELTSDEIDSLGILRFNAQELVDGERFYWLDVPITPYRSPLRDANEALARHPMATAADAERYLVLLEKFGRWIGGLEVLLREQARRGRVLPAPEIPLAVAPFKTLLRSPSPFQVAPERLAALPEELRRRMPEAIAGEIRDQVAPALGRLLSYLEGDYTRAAPEGVGLAQYPGGNEFYRWLVRQNTTLDIEPEEIHRIGVAEMERIEREMETLRIEVRFLDPLPQFRAWLRSAPRFFAKTPEEVGAKLLAAQERLTPKLPQLFGRMPKAPYGVERLDPALEGAMTFGYYDPPNPARDRGLYYFNGSQLDRRSTLNAAALIYHELAPGHHFQIALQRESTTLPSFRRDSFVTAFTEGWGEYASALAGEAGMYDDPYDRLGRLMMESFITARLVVDTGMNVLGWTREQAMDYMAQNTLQSPEEIASETLRYSCDIPAQALAYKLGARRIHQLRDRAAQELGPAFDLRRFHDELLAGGAMPLSVLERRIERFIAAEKTKGASAGAP
jgi:uncharacterized protein (DUF885 family)